MKNNKTILLTMALALCFTFGAMAAAAAALPDADNSTIGAGPADETAYAAAIAGLNEYGIIQGDPDGGFRPDDPLTFAEMAALIARSCMFRITDDYSETREHWAEKYVMACAYSDELRIFEGITTGSYDQQVGLRAYAEAIGAFLSGRYPVELDSLMTYDDAGTLTRSRAAYMLFDALNAPLVAGPAEVGGEAAVTILDVLYADALMENAGLLRYFTLAGYYEDSTINAVKLVDEPAAYLYDAEYDVFLPVVAAPEGIIYNFVAIYDAAGDGAGDTLFIVKRGDAEGYWDSEATYENPDDPGAFTNEYNIPFGGRLLGHEDIFDGAVVDFSNIAISGDLSSSAYYYTYDWYNSTSTDTLTMLTGFRTFQQTTGWACGLTSAIMAMDWFDMRGGLNELDLAALRNTREKYGAFRWGGATDVQMLINAFGAINDMEGSDVWKWESTYDFVDDDGELLDDYLSPEWIIEMLDQGRPILVGWNSFGAHWQVIIGYDDMGTEDTADDVLILADPYDTTDHLNDGYNIQSYERLYYDWTQNFDRDFSREAGYGMPVIFAPYPADYGSSAYEKVMGDGPAFYTDARKAGVNESDDMLIPYGTTAADLENSEYAYAKAEAGENGLAGAASSDYYRQSQHIGSRYYPQPDFWNGAAGISETLILLEGYGTSQQASEWTCGPSALRTVLNWFGQMGGETEFSLAHLRENDREGATTLDGMAQIFDGLDCGFAYFTTDDLDDDDCIGGFCLYDGPGGGLIPYCLENGIPILIGWDEWGGHWQVIIGYDDMGTEGTQDDVLILADPYDTTDHLQDGYVIESFERLVYGWGAAFDRRGGETFIIAAPAELLAEAFGG